MFPILNQTADQLHASLTEHCETSGDQYTRIFSDVATAATAKYDTDKGSFGGPGVSVSGNAAGECNVAATALPGSGVGVVYSNHGTQVGTVTSSGAVTFAAGAEWVMPPDAITRFSGLNNLLTSILPGSDGGGILDSRSHPGHPVRTGPAPGFSRQSGFSVS